MNLAIYAFMLFGFCYIIGHSMITRPFRKRMERWGMIWTLTLVECPACLSFWVGLFVSWIFPNVAIEIAGSHFFYMLPFALLSSGMSAILGLTTKIME